ncbi:MAG: hypothetical protein E6Q97_20150 [Desulfurellales bacterium]|nr:MAG: hypothetical protein E6Q97_20150 [Desulfurellales bacterium]
MPRGYSNGKPVANRRLPIPDNVRLDWDEPTPIDEAKTTHGKRRWVCRAGTGGGNAPCGKVWFARLVNRLSMGSGCIHCKRAKQRTPIPESVRATWADDRESESVAYRDTSAKWRCPSCAKVFKSAICTQIRSAYVGCTVCKFKGVRPQLRKRQPTEAMLLEWGEEFPIEQAFFRRTAYRWFCRARVAPCGKSWFTQIDNRFKGDGCPHCARKPKVAKKPTGVQRRMAKCQEAIRQVALLGSMKAAAAVVGVHVGTLSNWGKRGYMPKTIGGCKSRYAQMLNALSKPQQGG